MKIDHTKCANCRKCPRYFYLRDVVGLQNTGKRTPLQYGTGIHKACDMRFADKPVDEAIAAFKKIVPEDLDEKRTVATGIQIIRDYYKEYATQPFDEVLGIELMEKVDLTAPDGTEIEYYCKLDKLVKWIYGITPIDHKTTSIYIAQYTKMAESTHQYTGYIYTIQQKYPDAHDLLIDAIHIPRALKSGEVKTQFTRIPVARTEEHFREWKDWVYLAVSQMQKFAAEDNYPQEKARCWDFNSACEFKELCDMPIDHHAQAEQGMKHEGFIIEPWEPWNE